MNNASNCYFNALNSVRKECQDKQRCSFKVTNKFLGCDPCVNVIKQLYVEYECIIKQGISICCNVKLHYCYICVIYHSKNTSHITHKFDLHSNRNLLREQHFRCLYLSSRAKHRNIPVQSLLTEDQYRCLSVQSIFIRYLHATEHHYR